MQTMILLLYLNVLHFQMYKLTLFIVIIVKWHEKLLPINAKFNKSQAYVEEKLYNLNLIHQIFP